MAEIIKTPFSLKPNNLYVVRVEIKTTFSDLTDYIFYIKGEYFTRQKLGKDGFELNNIKIKIYAHGYANCLDDNLIERVVNQNEFWEWSIYSAEYSDNDILNCAKNEINDFVEDLKNFNSGEFILK